MNRVRFGRSTGAKLLLAIEPTINTPELLEMVIGTYETQLFVEIFVLHSLKKIINHLTIFLHVFIISQMNLLPSSQTPKCDWELDDIWKWEK